MGLKLPYVNHSFTNEDKRLLLTNKLELTIEVDSESQQEIYQKSVFSTTFKDEYFVFWYYCAKNITTLINLEGNFIYINQEVIKQLHFENNIS